MGSLGSAHSSSHQTGTAESRKISSFRINSANTIAAGKTKFNINNDLKGSLIYLYLLLLYRLFNFISLV